MLIGYEKEKEHEVTAEYMLRRGAARVPAFFSFLSELQTGPLLRQDFFVFVIHPKPCGTKSAAKQIFHIIYMLQSILHVLHDLALYIHLCTCLSFSGHVIACV